MSKIVASITGQFATSLSELVDEYVEREMKRLHIRPKDLKHYRLDISDHNFSMDINASYVHATYKLRLVKKDE